MNISTHVRFQLFEKIACASASSLEFYLREDRLQIFHSRGQFSEALNIVRGFLSDRHVRSVLMSIRCFADVPGPFQ